MFFLLQRLSSEETSIVECSSTTQRDLLEDSITDTCKDFNQNSTISEPTTLVSDFKVSYIADF